MTTELIRYPLYPTSLSLYDKVVSMLRLCPAYCPVCGNFTITVIKGDNLRETCICIRCRSSNRQRQIAFVLNKVFSDLRGLKIRSLKGLANIENLSIYNAESNGAVHERLRRSKGYSCSEYFGPQYKSGEEVKGVTHQDMVALSFNDSAFDLVVSSDVLEHIPEPYAAHKEIYRVLKPQGRHIFTVPFYQTEFLDEQRAEINPEGENVFLKEPQYHGDPLRPDGVLVYRIFSLEMLVELRKIGFRTNMYVFRKPAYGIIGPNAVVFEAIKDKY